MAENQNKEVEIKKPDLELLTHKYSDYYPSYYMYDVREIDYPIYRTKVGYEFTKIQEIHPNYYRNFKNYPIFREY